ncbi:hypothetical protein SKAU_G00229490 [Synaphobranchus kaupii]|uniref:Uncharacterized protein n=1 Tax=Synaphobranchus kaupii TaxID=118154 RepID=A0A9Q1IR26_SYNKA|nr:hypothetical protein SKAU_G00229490 [Synaphobranchus kaupii]
MHKPIQTQRAGGGRSQAPNPVTVTLAGCVSREGSEAVSRSRILGYTAITQPAAGAVRARKSPRSRNKRRGVLICLKALSPNSSNSAERRYGALRDRAHGTAGGSHAAINRRLAHHEPVTGQAAGATDEFLGK